MKGAILENLNRYYGSLITFWEGSGEPPDNISTEAHCDIIYTYKLLGREHAIAPKAVDYFIDRIGSTNLPGWKPTRDGEIMSVHNCAYAFGALNLLADDKASVYDRILDKRELELDQLIDPKTFRPQFPQKWAHHNWRVSHWIGGVPSIILSLAESGSGAAQVFAPLLSPVREAIDELIDPESGLLRAYSSTTVQAIFRLLYSLRHNPSLGDVGGIAHVTWFDHCIGRRYVNLPALLNNARGLFYAHRPFMEKAPYCLDFDVVQIVRTGQEQMGGRSGTDSVRAAAMMREIENFFSRDKPADYTLHKYPGALATYHECAMLSERQYIFNDKIKPIDIIKAAKWL